MNPYEKKALQEIEGRQIGACISLVLFGVIIAFIIAAFIAGLTHLPFQPVFYTTWALLELWGVLGVVAVIKEKRDRKRGQTA